MQALVELNVFQMIATFHANNINMLLHARVGVKVNCQDPDKYI